MDVATDQVDLVGDETVENVARAVLFAAITGATAVVTIRHPASPVGITLQTLWVFLAGILLGPIWAGAAFTIYTTAGAVGLPVFAGGASGIGVFGGFSGGFIPGFVIGAVAIGLLVHGTGDLRDPREVSVARLAVALVVGGALVFAAGALGYAINTDTSLWTAVELVVLPFLPGDVVKAVAAIGIVRSDALVAR